MLGCGALAAVLAGRASIALAWRRYRGLVLVLLAMTALAVTPHVTAGGHVILPIGTGWLERPFSIVRASGRAFWIVGYAVMLAAVAWLASRLRPVMFAACMAAAVALQWADTAPLRHDAVRYLAGTGQVPPAMAMPGGVDLFRTVPVCDAAGTLADQYRLVALRQGTRLADARLAHEPAPAACAASLNIGLRTQLAPGEARLFLPSVAAAVPSATLGAGESCTRGIAGMLCYRPRSTLGSTRPVPAPGR